MEMETLKYLIALTCLYPNNVHRVRMLLDNSATVQEAWERADSDRQVEAMRHAERELEFIARHDIKTYYYQNEDYPYRLKQCPDAPILLFGKGNLQLDKGKFVSIVGTRSASENGKEQTRQLVLDLAKMVPDVTIISGLAYGIDVTAHRAALEAGVPTIIIPAHGLDRIYPSLHRQVAVDALAKGGLLTEYPSETVPDKVNFVARNRIVAGLADAVVVAESKLKGGSLITAYDANDYDRNLYAFPGRPRDVNSQGCNTLIRTQRAMLINNAEDLVNDMQWKSAVQPVQTEIEDLFADMDGVEKQLIKIVRGAEDGIHVDRIAELTALPYAQVASSLMVLEMSGFIKMLPGNMCRALK